jgi:conjugal transfer pilus assembly protein TraB
MNLGEWWELQDSKRQRNIKIGLGLLAVFVVMWMMPGRERSEAPETISPVEVDILGDDQGAGDVQQMASEMKVMKGEYDRLLRMMEQQTRRIQTLQNSLAAATNLKENPEQLGALVDELNRMKEDLQDLRETGQISSGAPQAAAPVQLVLGGEDNDAGGGGGANGSPEITSPFSDLTTDDPGPIAKYDPLASVQGAISENTRDNSSGGRFNFMKDNNLERPPPKIVIDEPAHSPRPAPRSNGSRPSQSSRDRRGEEFQDPEAPEVYIPSGSLMEGVLLNGMDAPTSSGSATDPYPVTIRLTSLAFLPNRFTTNVRECMVLAAGFGRLDSERVHLRTEMISCILTDGGVIDVPLEGYVTGEDGKVGLRGVVVERTGQLLMRAALAGLGSGLSEAMRPQRVQSVRTGDNAGGIQFEPPETSDVLTVGAYAGAAMAMEKLADFYLQRADQIFPIIEVDAMRTVTVHLTAGVKLQTLDGGVHGALVKNESKR